MSEGVTRRSRAALLGWCVLALAACTTLPAVPRASVDGSTAGAGGAAPTGGASGHAGVDAGAGGAGTGGQTAGGSGGAQATGGSPGAGGSPAKAISFAAAPTTIMFTGSANAASVSPSIGLGDVDGDGRADLAVETTALTAQVFVNTGSAPFFTAFAAAAFQYAGGNGMQTAGSSLALGDVDGDGRSDLVFALTVGLGGGLPGPLELLPFLNSGGGAVHNFFTATPATIVELGNASSSSTTSVALADIDGDHKTDLAVVDAISTVGPNAGMLTVSTYLNNGGGIQGKFFSTTAAALSTFPGPQASNSTIAPPMGLGDINGDGLPDIAFLTSVDAISGSVGVSFYLNNAGGASAKFFAAQPALAFQGNGDPTVVPSAIALGDVNGDGKADLAVLAAPANADARTFEVFIYLNTSR